MATTQLSPAGIPGRRYSFIAKEAISIAAGDVDVTFSASQPGVAFTISKPGVSYSADIPGVTFTVDP